ncbi:hypothetical protein LTR62_005310 [Meristemomyces frigidus]|uniref:DUF7729 domain-containing protein n=1 Tax=Meristemomyces frigidus TaxID=1508187 RepID=A0AAN7TH05_9PEZI|nr:hypothetical protein LTR62_005310 [Meristemomyces frigidus]
MLTTVALATEHQTSNGFFAAEASPVRLAQTLQASCNVDYPKCASLMSSLAQNIQLNAHCGADLAMQNPTVLQAYNGFLAYQPLYTAGCIQDDGGNYCFADAVTNKSAPTSSYVYYLPLGVQLPASASPACNTCMQQTMAVFATAASNRSNPLSMDYASAAQQINSGCGTEFVDNSVVESSGAVATAGLSPGLTSLALCVLGFGVFV